MHSLFGSSPCRPLTSGTTVTDGSSRISECGNIAGPAPPRPIKGIREWRPQRILAEDDHLIQALIFFDLTNRSGKAFKSGDRGGSFIRSIPDSARIARNSAVWNGSRSWIRKRFHFKI